MSGSGYALQNSWNNAGLLETLDVSRYGFEISKLGFIYPSEMRSEVVKNRRVCAIPGTHKWFCGVINIRGHLVPVFDLNNFFFHETTDSNLYLVLDKGSKAVALRITQFPELLEDIQKADNDGQLFNQLALPASMNDHIIHYYSSGSRLWLEFDKDTFFSSLKKHISVHS